MSAVAVDATGRVAVPETAAIAAMTPAQRGEALRRLHQLADQARAAEALYVQRIDALAAHTTDGHRSVAAWVRSEANTSPADAARVVRAGRLMAELATVESGARDGTIGMAQVDTMARIGANPRVRPHLAAAEEFLIHAAHTEDFATFAEAVALWAELVDVDGAHDHHERAHRNRRARLSTVGDSVFLDAVGASAAGVELQAVFEAFCHSEWLADWEQGQTEHGDEMCATLMARSHQQRAFDALVAIFLSAAANPDGPKVPEPVVNLIIGQERFEHHLASMLSGEIHPRLPIPEPSNSSWLPAARGNFDPTDPLQVCGTADGTPIDPYDAVIAALTGHVRRVVLDAAGVVVDVGQRRRLFTGPLREAVMLHHRRCIWPGCLHPASACEADHTLPYSTAGPTATRNGAPVCAHHNRFRTRGYHTWRDPAGHWHHYRPDRTEIGWRHAS